MFGDLFAPTHLLVILFVAFLVIGPKKLPEMAAGLGKGIRDFRRALEGTLNSEPEPPHVLDATETVETVDAPSRSDG